MKLARYIGKGEVAIVEEPAPTLPPGGLLVRTEACGLCSGELMDWYMDRKIPHVLGHEVAGIVIESDDERFPVGSRVAPHHHVACQECEFCKRGLFVHCKQWKATKLIPGGMSEIFAIAKENLAETIIFDELAAPDSALLEPLACVLKSVACESTLRTNGVRPKRAVIGLGALGILHMHVLRNAVGYDISPQRITWACNQGLEAHNAKDAQPADTVIVCPGKQAALDLAARIVSPGGTIILFAPIPGETKLDLDALYFKDATITTSYSCGPIEIRAAAQLLSAGAIRAEQVVSDFIKLDELPKAYQAMKKGEILKAMVVFD